MWEQLLLPVLSLSGLSFIFGAGLDLASKKFAVPKDENVDRIREVLPGANCGGCGQAGCDAFAEAVAAGKAPVNGCPVGGAPVAEKVAAIMGVEAETEERKVARVLCQGDCDQTSRRFEYKGIEDCIAACMTADGQRGCKYGCLGFGTCQRVCPFDAIHVNEKGLAVVDRDQCTACGKCVAACPRNIIELIPASSTVQVACHSRDNGREVRANCKIGCIGCRICEKVCPSDAIVFENNLAKVDYQKCTECMKCAEKCPTGAIAVTPVLVH